MSEFNIEVQGGTAVKLPTAGKYCEKDIIVTAIGGGGLEEIEQMIDESGVLDSTEGTATEKVEQLIDKAEWEELFYEQSKRWSSHFNDLFSGFAGEKIPRLFYETATNLRNFLFNCRGIKSIDYYLETPKCTDFQRMFCNTSNLKTIVGFSTIKATNLFECFYESAIESIQEPLDFSNVVNNTRCFSCSHLKEIFFVKESIKISISFTSSDLTAESVQSIIDGLAYVTTAQTLTLPKVFENDFVKLPAELRDLINTKGWTLAFA